MITVVIATLADKNLNILLQKLDKENLLKR